MSVGASERSVEVAEFDIPVLILKLSKQFEHGLTAEELYERTRGVWKINPAAHANVRYAMPISADGTIREVYRILRWIEVDMSTLKENPLRRQGLHAESKSRYRWMFEGEIDLNMRARYRGKIVPYVRAQMPTLWRGPVGSAMEGPSIQSLQKP